MVIRIVGGEQVVCDCQGDTPDKYLAKLLVGITESKDRVTVPVFSSKRYFSLSHEVTSRLAIESGPNFYTPTEARYSRSAGVSKTLVLDRTKGE